MNISPEIARIVELLEAGTQAIIPKEEFIKKLSLKRKLKIKLGVDPTAADLHLGHVVVLAKLRQFQDLGHDVIFLIGDFTARIGDPTGRSKTRPPLTEEQIAANTKTYLAQVGKILDASKVTIRYNSEWLDKLTSKEFVSLCAKVTLARLIEREDFATRMSEHIPIGFHELLYPLMQGYDSVALHADIELGGTDQTFNLLMGRYLQEHYNQEPQAILTVPLLEGLDGVNKMSKSLGNAIGIAEPADQAYGKLMSISDTLMWRYYELLLHKLLAEIKSMQEGVKSGSLHPMDLKKQMAHDIIARFWSNAEAQQAQQIFEELFQKKDYSHAQEMQLPEHINTSVSVIELIKILGGAPSSSEARRLIEAGALSINGEKVTDIKALITVASGMLVKVGKHKFYRIS
jgi:tyrosyl-tRNA synthetase